MHFSFFLVDQRRRDGGREVRRGVISRGAGRGNQLFELDDELSALVREGLARQKPKASSSMRAVRLAYPRNASRPVLVSCDDGREWIIKGGQLGKTPFNEQMIASLAALVAAPVPETGLVYVPPVVVRLEPQMAHFSPGLAHGSVRIDNCTEERALPYQNAENRARYAALSLLYSWTDSADEQVLYRQDPLPVLVYSHDHGYFLPPPGPEWTVDTLKAGKPPVKKPFFNFCGLSPGDYREPIQRIAALQKTDIASAVCRAPAEWVVSEDERCAVAGYLWARIPQVIDVFGRR